MVMVVVVFVVMRKTSSSLLSYLLLLGLPALKGKVERLQFITVLIISQTLLCNKDNTNYHYIAQDDHIKYCKDLQWKESSKQSTWAMVSVAAWAIFLFGQRKAWHSNVSFLKHGQVK